MHPYLKSRKRVGQERTSVGNDASIDRIATFGNTSHFNSNAGIVKAPTVANKNRRMPSAEIAALLSSDAHFREYVRNL